MTRHMDIVVERYRLQFGIHDARDWEIFATGVGLQCFLDELPQMIPAAIRDNTIIVQRGLPADEIAYLVWHEIAHRFLHAGDREFWLTALPGLQGELTLGKWERQADEFASAFPIWEE